MNITKSRITEIALGFVKQGEEYDRETIALQTASELVSLLQEEFNWTMSVAEMENLRGVFRSLSRNNIDWQRLNRKRDPEEYADLVWRGFADNEELAHYE